MLPGTGKNQEFEAQRNARGQVGFFPVCFTLIEAPPSVQLVGGLNRDWFGGLKVLRANGNYSNMLLPVGPVPFCVVGSPLEKQKLVNSTEMEAANTSDSVSTQNTDWSNSVSPLSLPRVFPQIQTPSG